MLPGGCCRRSQGFPQSVRAAQLLLLTGRWGRARHLVPRRHTNLWSVCWQVEKCLFLPPTSSAQKCLPLGHPFPTTGISVCFLLNCTFFLPFLARPAEFQERLADQAVRGRPGEYAGLLGPLRYWGAGTRSAWPCPQQVWEHWLNPPPPAWPRVWWARTGIAETPVSSGKWRSTASPTLSSAGRGGGGPLEKIALLHPEGISASGQEVSYSTSSLPSNLS